MVPREPRKKTRKQANSIESPPAPDAIADEEWESLESPPAPDLITDEEWEGLFRRSVLLRPLTTELPPLHDLTAALASGVLEIEARVTGSRPRGEVKSSTGESTLPASVDSEPAPAEGHETRATRHFEITTAPDLGPVEVPAEPETRTVGAGLVTEIGLDRPLPGDAKTATDADAQLADARAVIDAELLELDREGGLALAVDVAAEVEAGAAPADRELLAGDFARAALTEEEWRERFFKRGQVTGLMEGDDLLILTAPDVAGGVTTLRLRGQTLSTVAAAALRQAPTGFAWRDHDDLVLMGIVLDWWLRGVALESRPAAVREAVQGMAERYSGLMERLTALLPPR